MAQATVQALLVVQTQRSPLADGLEDHGANDLLCLPPV
jgi:hypothetical protein